MWLLATYVARKRECMLKAQAVELLLAVTEMDTCVAHETNRSIQQDEYVEQSSCQQELGSRM